MTLTIAIDLAMIIMSFAVLIQSARMMRRLKTMRDSSMQEMVAAIDRSTAEARVVLDGLKSALASDMHRCNEVIARGQSMREELDVMTGIANTVAERILETVRDANAQVRQREAEARQRDAEAPQPLDRDDWSAVRTPDEEPMA